jgi:hypothetical protein
MAGSNAVGMVDPQIFEDLQAKIDEDTQVKEKIRVILQILERQGRTARSILSRAHSIPTSKRKQAQFSMILMQLTHPCTVEPIIVSAEAAIRDELGTVGELAVVASDFPYYKFVPPLLII